MKKRWTAVGSKRKGGMDREQAAYYEATTGIRSRAVPKPPTLCELCGKQPKKFVTRRKCIRCEKKVCIDCREGGRSHKRGGSGLCNSCLKEGMVPKA